jgi:hypothetical protein
MTKHIIVLLLIILTVSPNISSQQLWPIKRDIDLSSGFGDFRQNRFHAGIDIRTGGKEGEQVFSPSDGWLYRIKMSYWGYGKGLYIQDDEGHIYVFGHLKDFSDKIDKIVKQHQLKIQRYYFDQYYLKDLIFIKQGDLIGYSGQTGTGAPHLHFEKRKSESFPINPLTHGFKINDNVKPIFNQLIFKMLDDNSLFENGKRELVVDEINNGNGNYHIDSTLIFHNKVGIVVGVFDQMRRGGMKQTVTNLSLLIDGNPVYEIVHDTLDFRTMRSVNLEFDYNRAVDNQKTFRRLYHIDGNIYKGSKALNESNGILDPALLTGKHTGEIIATDSYGNSSRISFDFELMDRHKNFTSNKFENINDSIFDLVDLDYEIIDNGLLVTANGLISSPKNSLLKLYKSDTLLETLSPQTTINNEASFYISPQPKLKKIDKIEFSLDKNGKIYRKIISDINLKAVGFEDKTKISFKDMNLNFNRNSFYNPRFIEFQKYDIFFPISEKLSSNHYHVFSAWLRDHKEVNVHTILPHSFLCKERFPIFFSIDTTQEDYNKLGLYWYNEKHNEWLWIDNKIVNDTLYSFSEGGGHFAILKDTLAPSIRNLSIKHLKTYFTSMTEISFNLKDDLSWIEDDRNFLVTLDDEWLIPEYDFEKKLFQTKPNHSLKDGKHKLEIQITDRVGNKLEQTVEFYVKVKQTNKGN